MSDQITLQEALNQLTSADPCGWLFQPEEGEVIYMGLSPLLQVKVLLEANCDHIQLSGSIAANKGFGICVPAFFGERGKGVFFLSTKTKINDSSQ